MGDYIISMNNEIVSVTELSEKRHLEKQELVAAYIQLLGAMVKLAYLDRKCSISHIFDYMTPTSVIGDVAVNFKNLGYEVETISQEGPGFTVESKMDIKWRYRYSR